MISAAKNQTKAILDKDDLSTFNMSDIPMPIKEEFEYDDFQKRSMIRLSQNKCVFVSAPTSTGKTVVATYAIGLSRIHNKKAIYTSPIKSLSNQKFKEFSQDFGKVGILTGDINLNRDAPILIMTTEILRSMLYKNDPLLNDVEVVIFDEFHYLSNQQRGGVWEESVIRMPSNINMVFLSASMPNAKEIANWISKTKNIDVYIEQHEKRPVPLNHCLFINDEIFTISNQKDHKDFDIIELFRAKRQKVPKKADIKTRPYMINLIFRLQSQDLLPALMFEFSIVSIEQKADLFLNCCGVNLVTNKEKAYIEQFFNENVLKRLHLEDMKLPQVQRMFALLRMGIGVHHSGILPILKEAVEILLNDGYIKFVFCTSTIGMGLNLPVRTCCFTNLQKFNGSNFEDLSSTEYQQMSGRAGRRGKDKIGYSVLCLNGKFPSEEYLRNIFCGEAEEIKSQFQVSFKMVINSFCQQSNMKIHEIMRKSFFEISGNSELSKLNKVIEKQKNILSKMILDSNCPHINNENDNKDIEDIEFHLPIHSFVKKFNSIYDVNSEIVTKYRRDFEKALKIGTFVLYMDRSMFMIAIIDDIIYSTGDDDDDDDEETEEIEYISLMLPKGETFEVKADHFEYLYLLALPPTENMKSISIEEKQRILNQYNPREKLNKYVDFIDLNNDDFITRSNLHYKLISEIVNSPCFNCPSFKDHFKVSLSTVTLRDNIQYNEKRLMDEEKKEYGKYLEMLKEMNYIIEENGKYRPTIKGEIANDIYGDEIISTELINSKIFDNCTMEELAALCSCLVAQRVGQKNYDPKSISPNVDIKVYTMREMIRRIVSKMKSNKIPFEEDFINLNMNIKAMYCVYKWAKGDSFSDVMDYADKILEGQMANIITKTSSLLTNFSEIEANLDNKKMANKFKEAAKLLQRGVIFAKSIYLYLD